MRQPTEMEMLLSRNRATFRHPMKLTLPLRIRSLISQHRRGCWLALQRCTAVSTAGTSAGGRHCRTASTHKPSATTLVCTSERDTRDVSTSSGSLVVTTFHHKDKKQSGDSGATWR